MADLSTLIHDAEPLLSEAEDCANALEVFAAGIESSVQRAGACYLTAHMRAHVHALRLHWREMAAAQGVQHG